MSGRAIGRRAPDIYTRFAYAAYIFDFLALSAV